MTRKNVIKPFKAIDAGDMSDASVTGSSSEVLHLDNVGYQAVWSGTSPVGVITVEVSNDGTNWTELTFSNTIDVSGNSGSVAININQTPFKFIRPVYTKTSGTGSITITLTAKMI